MAETLRMEAVHPEYSSLFPGLHLLFDVAGQEGRAVSSAGLQFLLIPFAPAVFTPFTVPAEFDF